MARMADEPTLTSESGAPVTDNQNSQIAGPGGPTLLQDHYLIEKLARFNRERIPERVVHAVGSGAYGYLEVTSPEVPKWTKMKVFEQVGKRTDMFIRFSTVAASRGGPDVARDPRGFAMKYYTEDGNWDLVGNNTPVFFIRDGIKFPDFIHSQKQRSVHEPAGAGQRLGLFLALPGGHAPVHVALRRPRHSRVVPPAWTASARTRSSGSTRAGERFWVKFHFKTDQGIATLTSEEAAIVGGQDQFHCHKDLTEAIEQGRLPALDVEGPGDARGRRGDLSHRSVRLHEGLELPRLSAHPDCQARAESAARQLLRGGRAGSVRSGAFRAWASGRRPIACCRRVCSATATRTATAWASITRVCRSTSRRGSPAAPSNYGRDGFMRFDDNRRRAKNYEPNTFDGPVQTNQEHYEGFAVTGRTGHYPQVAARGR